eukprot:6872364-Heterocapsa_arctica.AAC.1
MPPPARAPGAPDQDIAYEDQDIADPPKRAMPRPQQARPIPPTGDEVPDTELIHIRGMDGRPGGQVRKSVIENVFREMATD